MAPVFPLSRLAFLFVKQIARPLSSSIRRKAIKSIFFRKKICLPPARFYHWCEVRMKMYVMNIGQMGEKATIPKLNEDAAIDLGASLLGEGVIFAVAVGVLGYEYNRQKEKDRKKEEEQRLYFENLENQIHELSFSNEELDTRLRELTRILYSRQHSSQDSASESTSHKVPERSSKANTSPITRAIADAESKIRSK